jgi:hypothetical protein
MKILTKEEEQAHYNATLRGGLLGGVVGLSAGLAGVYLAHRRFPAFRGLTLPLRAFLITSAGTFGAIVEADRGSRRFEQSRHPESSYVDRTQQAVQQAREHESTLARMKDWGKRNRYPIVGASWVASMGIALALVGRQKYLTAPQKLVQARVYAQGLTLAVLVATAAFEVGDARKGEGKYETVMVLDPNDPEHKHLIEKRVHLEEYAGEDQWKDMVDAEERRIKARKAQAKEELSKHKS